LKIQHLNQKLILGSSSSYRYELLLRLQLPFEVSSPDIDESALIEEIPEATASRLAEEKARAVASIHPDALII
jgi:septum formation protein